MQKLTLETAAAEFDVSKTTLRRGLLDLRLGAGRGKTWTIAELHRALSGDVKAQRARLLKHDANLRELEEEERRGNLISVDEAKRIIAEAIAPIRSALVSWPASLSARCNPSDPELAREVLHRAVHRLLTEASRS